MLTLARALRRSRRTLGILAFALVGCSSQIVPAATPTFDAVNLRIFATTAAAPLAHELTLRYAQMYPVFTFERETGNFASMAERLLSGDISYLLSNYIPPQSSLWAAPLGQDGIAIIVHPEVSISGLTSAQLRRIYQGQIQNWAEVGGPDMAITVISREDGSGTRAEFDQLVMGQRRTTRLARLAPSSVAMIESVAQTPGSIGYVSMALVNDSVRALAIDGSLPTPETVFDNTYPLRSTLFIIGRAEPQDQYRTWVAWIQSQEGQAIVARHYAALG